MCEWISGLYWLWKTENVGKGSVANRTRRQGIRGKPNLLARELWKTERVGKGSVANRTCWQGNCGKPETLARDV
jgi:hypothetical protein